MANTAMLGSKKQAALVRQEVRNSISKLLMNTFYTGKLCVYFRVMNTHYNLEYIEFRYYTYI